MSYSQTVGNAATQSGNSMGIGGGYYNTVHTADPDIAAQGAVSQKLQDQNLAFQQKGLDWQKQKFNTGMGLLQSTLAGFQNQNGRVGGDSGQGPHIQGGPLWTQQGINQNVNANNASVDQQTATGQRGLANKMASQGFGTRSPLAMALAQQGQQSGMAQKADYTRQFVPEARQQNAKFNLSVGQAQESQFAQRQQEDIQRRQALAQQQNSLLSALGGFMN